MTSRPRLIILEEPGVQREVIADGPSLEIGRAPRVDVVLSDRMVSRHHAVIRRSGPGLILEDIGSTFGTSVNGRRIHQGSSIALRDGDVIELGKVQILCHLEDEALDIERSAANAVFAAQANARLIVLELGEVRYWPVGGSTTRIGRAGHCEVRLGDRAGPPELAILRTTCGRFTVSPRSKSIRPSLNENQVPVEEETPLESNSVIVLDRAQLLFLYDFDGAGRPVLDPLLDLSRSRLLRRVSEETGIACGKLKRLCTEYRALGQHVGELLVREKLLTPLFWRVVSSRVGKATQRSGWWPRWRKV